MSSSRRTDESVARERTSSSNGSPPVSPASAAAAQAADALLAGRFPAEPAELVADTHAPSVARTAFISPGEARPVPDPDPGGGWDLDRPELYLNRELTWLGFNWRVLAMAEDDRTPLLERFFFLSIVSSNLDEFFMKRIGGLKQQLEAGVKRLSPDGRTPREQIEESYAQVRQQVTRKRVLARQLFGELEEHGIRVRAWEELEETDREWLRQYYLGNVFPLVTPQATDPAHPFPFVSNLSLNLLVTLHYPDDDLESLARVKVPLGPGVPRFIRLRDSEDYVPLESVMEGNLDLLFPGMVVESCEQFRVTRNADTEQDEETADDLLSMIETELRYRKFAPIVRLEVGAGMTPRHRGMLAAELGLDEAQDVFEVEGMLALRDLMELASIEEAELRYAPHHPVDNPAFVDDRSIFHIIRDAESVLVHHPYESFHTSVERFLKEAAEDPKVRAIKMTFYRTSAESKPIEYLMEAARNGKQVAVVMEIKARFDEAANIRWASKLGAAGIHVTYGVLGLKTHCKSIMVVRQDYDGLRRYCHVGTGNYHAGTARGYCDLGLFTCDEQIGRDLTELFNYLTTGYRPKREYGKVLPAPKIMKPAIIDKIAREIEHAKAGETARVQFKLNALEDPDVTRALYEASQAGVKVDLIVRDTCRLRPGIPGLSENVRVVSILGRFLEHARIYYFHNGGEEEYWIGSADAMRRNLKNRVELLAPVEDPAHRQTLSFIIDRQLTDRRLAWEMRPDGSCVQLLPSTEAEETGSQERFIGAAGARNFDATRLRRRKPLTPGRHWA
ncbi:MAG: polyphosphate kinase 1 [marine benthic group bacterium]|nr:polyphosphate kinase 1 [Gemmatimonadota bacterium]